MNLAPAAIAVGQFLDEFAQPRQLLAMHAPWQRDSRMCSCLNQPCSHARLSSLELQLAHLSREFPYLAHAIAYLKLFPQPLQMSGTLFFCFFLFQVRHWRR